MRNKLRWGIAGCAGIAVNAVMPAIQSSETSVIQAVASRDGNKSRETAEKFGVSRSYGSYEALMADPDIDAVYIPLPNHLHREWAIRAAEAGKHVLCEKPLALTAGQAEEMAEACAKAGVHLAEAFMYRHHPRIAHIRQIVDTGEIGRLRAVRGAFTFNNADDRKNIRYRKEWGGGSLYDVGCYPLSAARLIIGREPEAATVHAMFSPEHDHVDMMASGLVEFPDGIALTFDCGMWTAFWQTLEIVGSEGRIVVPYAFLTGSDNAGFEVYRNGEVRQVHADGVNAYQCEIDEFARVVAGKKEPEFPAEDAIRNMRLLEACLRSAQQRERIALG